MDLGLKSLGGVGLMVVLDYETLSGVANVARILVFFMDSVSSFCCLYRSFLEFVFGSDL